jgi:NAD(P)-dependent dehydrogenase (short-subunit alcohol dehydrogenase family)
LTPEDLKAAKVDVAIFGAPLDMGFGMRGAAFGPQAIRVSERYLSWGDAQSGASRPHQHVRIDPFHTALVNNAGVGPGLGRLEEIDLRDIRRTLEVNVIGVHLCAAAAIRRMARRHGGTGGAIVNVSSAAARIGSPGAFVHYAASKGAVDVLTIGLGKEAMTEGIRVNAVRPGVTDTEMLRGGPGFPTEPGNEEWLAGVLKTLPIGRVARPDEVAEVIMWLLSDGASYVTGAIVDVSGGRATP